MADTAETVAQCAYGSRVPADANGFDPTAEIASLYRQGRYRDVLRRASAALRRSPGNALLWNVSAGAAYALGLQQDAECFWNTAVAHNPDYAEAHYNLGVLHFEQGHLEAAARSLSRAVDLAPGHSSALNNLGAVLAEMRRFEEAAALLRRSVALDATNPQAFHNLALALMELGRTAEARASLERALALKPDFAEALASSASLSLQCGDHEAAARLVDAALAVGPRNGTAHLLRAAQGSTVRDSAWLAQLRDAYRQRSTRPLRDVIRLNFAMGKACEDLGEYDAAFHAYAEGNRLRQGCYPFDEAAEERSVQALISTYGPELYCQTALRGAPPDDCRVPVFVIGMPRSGTTLVEQILASHPQVAGAGELTTLDEICASLPKGVPPAEARADWLAKLRAAGEDYLDRVWRLHGRKDFIVDKMPSNYRHLGLLPLMIPHARIIHVTRDPLDTCVSCFATPFAHGHEYAFDQGTVGRHYVRYRRLMDHWERILPTGRIMPLRYETLVTEMEPQTKAVLAHIGLPWSDACVRFYENRRGVKTASHAQVRQPLYRRSIGRWRRFERHLAALRAALAPVLTCSVTGSAVLEDLTPAIQVPASGTDTAS